MFKPKTIQSNKFDLLNGCCFFEYFNFLKPKGLNKLYSIYVYLNFTFFYLYISLYLIIKNVTTLTETNNTKRNILKENSLTHSCD